jgi:hypothetical protein
VRGGEGRGEHEGEIDPETNVDDYVGYSDFI